MELDLLVAIISVTVFATCDSGDSLYGDPENISSIAVLTLENEFCQIIDSGVTRRWIQSMHWLREHICLPPAQILTDVVIGNKASRGWIPTSLNLVDDGSPIRG